MKVAAFAVAALALAACQAGPQSSTPTGANAELVRGMYDDFNRGDIPAVAAALAPDVEWMEAENFVYADRNPYLGPDAVVEGVFSRAGAEWTGMQLAVSDILESGDRVVTFGRITGRYNATGAPIDAQFAHVWRIEDGQVVSFQQYVDTLQFARAVAGVSGKGKAKPEAASAGPSGKAKAKPAAVKAPGKTQLQPAKVEKAPGAKKKPAKKRAKG